MKKEPTDKEIMALIHAETAARRITTDARMRLYQATAEVCRSWMNKQVTVRFETAVREAVAAAVPELNMQVYLSKSKGIRTALRIIARPKNDGYKTAFEEEFYLSGDSVNVYLEEGRVKQIENGRDQMVTAYQQASAALEGAQSVAIDAYLTIARQVKLGLIAMTHIDLPGISHRTILAQLELDHLLK